LYVDEKCCPSTSLLNTASLRCKGDDAKRLDHQLGWGACAVGHDIFHRMMKYMLCGWTLGTPRTPTTGPNSSGRSERQDQPHHRQTSTAREECCRACVVLVSARHTCKAITPLHVLTHAPGKRVPGR
jgi:hypothetical protein